ncbi:hypothetical protein D3C74_305910 [compost metagenome]
MEFFICKPEAFARRWCILAAQQNHDVQRAAFCCRQLVEGVMAGTFICPAQVLGNVGIILGHAELLQISPDRSGAVVLIRQQRHFGFAIDALCEAFKRATVHAFEHGIMPALAKLGKCQLQRTEIRPDLQLIRADLAR